MTIPATPSQITHAGDGVSVAFPIPFVFDTSADIKVVTTTAAGIPTEIVTGFSITGGGGSTGTCTFVTAPAALTKVTLIDDPDLTQTADYISNDAFPADVHEGALDRTERQVKRLHQRVDRSLRVADGDLIDGDGNILPISSARAAKYLVFDAVGSPTVGSGTGGGDVALRADIASTTFSAEGARLVGHRLAAAAIARTVQSKLAERVSILDFGAVADDATDNQAAFAAASTWANALATPVEICFPAGIYRTSIDQNWFKQGVSLRALGRVVYRSTRSSGNIASYDAGANANGYYSNLFGDWVFDSTNAGVGIGLFVRNVHHSFFEASVRNVVSLGFYNSGCVLTHFKITQSATHGGVFTTTPVNGLQIDGSVSNTQSTDCIYETIIETCSGDGIILTKCGASIFTGTSEGCGGKGVQIGSPAVNFDNTFIGFFCEGNTGGDFDISGQGTTLINCTGSNATNAIKVRSGALRTKFISGTFHDATLDSGAVGTSFDGCKITTSITDAAPTTSRTIKINTIEASVSASPRPSQIYMQDDWTNATYSGAWGNSSGAYQRLQYTKNYSTNEILVRGEAGGGVSGTTIAVLPAGYRPSKSYSFICAANGIDDFASVTVDTSGNIVHTNPGYTPTIDLSSVRFFLG